MSKVLNPEAITLLLKRESLLNGRLLKQSAYRALEHDSRCLQRVCEYPDPPPKKISRAIFETKGPFYHFVATEEVNGLVDRIDAWLRNAIANQESWIFKADNAGRVTRLRNIKTLDDALKLCEEDEERDRRKRLASLDLAEGNDEAHVRVLAHLPDGYHAVQLCTADALRWEGRHMRHCLGQTSYALRLGKGRVQYVSIRNAAGRPRATLEVASGRLVQWKGHANSDPFPRYGSLIETLADHMDWECPDIKQPRDPIFDEFLAQERIDVWDDLLLTDAHLPLTRTMRVRGDLVIDDLPALTTLPEVLDVRGNLVVKNCHHLRYMPRWLLVGGDVMFSHCEAIRHLGLNFRAGGSVVLNDCPHLRLSRAATMIGRRLHVSQCPRIRRAVGIWHSASRLLDRHSDLSTRP